MKILIIGGNRFFGKILAGRLLERGDEVTLLNRGQIDDGFGKSVERLVCDRSDAAALTDKTANRKWDIIYDQACFEASDARVAAAVLATKTPHYVFTSSQSVYGPGAAIPESAFVPKRFHFDHPVKSSENYAEAKRQSESVLASSALANSTFVRFPIVMGKDDYTGRLKFHIDRVASGEPIHFPNRQASVSFIHANDAASALEFIGRRAPLAAVNVASREPLKIDTLVKEIERVVGKPAILADEDSKDNHSPYGLANDWWMNVDRIETAGFKAQPILGWLPGLIAALK